MKVKDLSISSKLSLLVIVFLAGLIAFGALSFSTLIRVRVNGAIYQSIVQGKDLIADILPPPEYIIESYLVVLQIEEETDTARQEELIHRLSVLKADYDTRHKFWAKDLPENAMKTTMVETAYKPAMEFFDTVDNEFIPALRQKDRQKTHELVQGKLKQSYARHREAIDHVVQLATERNKQDEQYAASIIATRSAILLGTLFVIAVLGVLFGSMLSRAIARPLRETS